VDSIDLLTGNPCPKTVELQEAVIVDSIELLNRRAQFARSHESYSVKNALWTATSDSSTASAKSPRASKVTFQLPVP